MTFDKIHSFRLVSSKGLGIGLFLAMTLGSFAEGLHLESAGARFGFYQGGADESFHQAEAFLNWNLPFAWELGHSWHLQSRLDASAGWLGDSSANAAIFTAGPSVLLQRNSFPLSLEGGVSPTVLTHTDFPSKDLGFPFQFTSHLGLNFDILSRIRLSYRFQHMSNGGLGPHNPGLNLHLFGLSYLF